MTLIDPACRALRARLAVRPQSDDPHLFLRRFERDPGSRGVEDVVKRHLSSVFPPDHRRALGLV